MVDRKVKLQESWWGRAHSNRRRSVPENCGPATVPEATGVLMGWSSRSRVAVLADSSRWRTWGVLIHVAVALHRVHQVGQRHLQSFAADPVSSFPDHNNRLANRFVVDASAPFYRRLLPPIVAELPQQPDSMLAVVASHRRV